MAQAPYLPIQDGALGAVSLPPLLGGQAEGLRRGAQMKMPADAS